MKNRPMLGTEISDLNVKCASTPVMQPLKMLAELYLDTPNKNRSYVLFFRASRYPPNIQEYLTLYTVVD